MSHASRLLGALALAATASLASGYTTDAPRVASVRFTNALSDARSVTLEANKKVLFADVPPASTTGDLSVQDTVVTFDLKWSGSDTVIATSNAPMANGAHYTVTANRATGQNPILVIMRDPGVKP